MDNNNNNNYKKNNDHNNNYNCKTSTYSIDSPSSISYIDNNNNSEITSPLLMYSGDIDNNDNKNIPDSSINIPSRQPSFSSPSLNLSFNNNHSYNTNSSTNGNSSNDNVLQNDQYANELKELEIKENEINRLVADMVLGGSTDIKKQQSLAAERYYIYMYT